MEIERKWLVDSDHIPAHFRNRGVSCLIKQHYLTATMDEEVRIKEVEFPSEEEAKKFAPPSWFGRENWEWVQTSVANKSEPVV